MTRPPLARDPPPSPFRSSWQPGQRPEPVPDELLGSVMRELAKMGLALVLAACVLAALLILGGCATTTADCTDLTKGICRISGTRLLTDSGISLVDPKTGLTLSFTSKPDQAGTQAAIAALSSTVGLLVKVLVPVVPPAPAPAPAPGYDPAALRDRLARASALTPLESPEP